MEATLRLSRTRIQDDGVTLRDRSELGRYFQYRDTLITQSAMLSAMKASAVRYGSRASALVLDVNGIEPSDQLKGYRMRPTLEAGENEALITCVNADGEPTSHWQPVTPIPQRDEWFENVWRGYRERTQ